MAKAKRERRTSIRTLPPDRMLGALDALEQAERAHAEQQTREPAEAERATPPTAEKSKE
jgi:hypothetical protein